MWHKQYQELLERWHAGGGGCTGQFHSRAYHPGQAGMPAGAEGAGGAAGCYGAQAPCRAAVDGGQPPVTRGSTAPEGGCHPKAARGRGVGCARLPPLGHLPSTRQRGTAPPCRRQQADQEARAGASAAGHKLVDLQNWLDVPGPLPGPAFSIEGRLHCPMCGSKGCGNVFAGPFVPLPLPHARACAPHPVYAHPCHQVHGSPISAWRSAMQA